MSAIDILNEVILQQGKPGAYPSTILFEIGKEGATLKAELIEGFDEKKFKEFDPWALAVLAVIQKRCADCDITRLQFCINPGTKRNRQFELNLEALRRRLSFLALNNPQLHFELVVDGNSVDLYSKRELLYCPASEVIGSASTNQVTDIGEQAEIAYQSSIVRGQLASGTHERQAILGKDFLHVNGKDIEILRDFMIGAYAEKVSEETRILPAGSIDVVTQSRTGNLALVMLALDAADLGVVSGILDFGLYAVRYREQIALLPEVAEMFEAAKVRHADFFCCMASDRFHPRLESIQRFYHVGTKNYGFCLMRMTLGAMAEI